MHLGDCSHRQRCPFSIFKGRENLNDQNSRLVLDSYGMRNPSDYSNVHAIVMGSSVVMGGDQEPSLTDIMNSIDQRLYFNCSCSSWNSVQSINQYIYSVAPAVRHDCVIFLCGYNDIFSPISYDPRPQYPYNFFVESEVFDALSCTQNTNNGNCMEFSFSANRSHLNINPGRIRSELIHRMFKDGSISTHFSSLASGWINALEVLVSYCQYHKTKLLIVPQLTILDKKRLSSLEMQFISSSPRYFEIFSAYKARYWKLIKQYLELFEFPDAISILDKSDQIFTDQVHLTELGYFNLSKYLCSLT